MTKSPLFKSFFSVLVLVALLDLIALKLHLFSTIMWFDMVMHFCGGFFIGLSILWVLTWNGKRDFSYGQILFWGVGSALVVGILWEFFELYFGITYLHSSDYIGDNGMDLIMDLSGSLLAVWYSYFKLKNS